MSWCGLQSRDFGPGGDCLELEFNGQHASADWALQLHCAQALRSESLNSAYEQLCFGNIHCSSGDVAISWLC